ncbi:MAG: hypothetical protein IPN33_00125 [Saprospiraceae bacterium]|nr:hypothetical protein [Saprospiraceae bacterium]
MSIIITGRETVSDSLPINVLPFDEIAKQIVTHPILNSVQTASAYSHVRYNDDGGKLREFFNLFQNSFNTAHDFITDKYWFDLFMEMSTSSKVEGDCISLAQLKDRYIGIVESLDGKLGLKGETWKNEENLIYGLTDTLTELCEYRVLLKGFIIKCQNCFSKYWYHLDEVKDLIKCRGCLKEINTAVEMKFEYKLNDLLKTICFKKW